MQISFCIQFIFHFLHYISLSVCFIFDYKSIVCMQFLWKEKKEILRRKTNSENTLKTQWWKWLHWDEVCFLPLARPACPVFIWAAKSVSKFHMEMRRHNLYDFHLCSHAQWIWTMECRMVSGKKRKYNLTANDIFIFDRKVNKQSIHRRIFIPNKN